MNVSIKRATAKESDLATELEIELLTEIMATTGEPQFNVDVQNFPTQARSLLLDGSYIVLFASNVEDFASLGFVALFEGYALYTEGVFGVNDVTIEHGAQRVSLTECRENFQRNIEVAQSRYSTMVIGPPPISDHEHNCRIQELSEAFGELAENIGVLYLPVYDTLENDAIWKKDVGEHDCAHPDVNGYSQLANLIQAWPSWWFQSHKTLKRVGS
jgi:hypothetical protein